MDGLVEPSMPKLPSVINQMKEVGAPPTGPQQQQQQYDNKTRRKSTFNDDTDEFSSLTEPKKLSFGEAKSQKKSAEADKQMAKFLYGKNITLTARQKADIAEAFNAFDVTGTGYMSTTDMRVALKALGFEARKEEMRKLLDEYDAGDTGQLCYSDFMNIIEYKLGEIDTKEDLIKAFKLFDKDDAGVISFQNLRDVADELGEDINDEEIAEMIAEADLDDNGSLDVDEFLKILKRTSLY